MGIISIDHNNAIVDEASKLFDLGFSVYLEHPIPLTVGGKAVVDIYALKGKQEVIVEVGSLSCPKFLMDKWSKGEISLCVDKHERIALIKEAKPNAKIVWIHQWKNYISTSEIQAYNQERKFERYLRSGQGRKDIIEMGLSL